MAAGDDMPKTKAAIYNNWSQPPLPRAAHTRHFHC